MKTQGLLVLLAGFFLFSACAPSPAASPPSTTTASAPSLTPPANTGTPIMSPMATNETSVGHPTASGGISFEEDVQMHPPMPTNLRASKAPDGILLEWDTPIPVTAPHTYSDIPELYRIYRRAENGELETIGSSKELHFLDTTAQLGVQYYYEVSAVHENNLEGTRTDAVKAPVR